MTVNFKQALVEPPVEKRGDIAHRVTLYMNATYSLGLDNAYFNRMRECAAADPVSTEDCLLNERIKFLQGFGNPLIEADC